MGRIGWCSHHTFDTILVLLWIDKSKFYIRSVQPVRLACNLLCHRATTVQGHLDQAGHRGSLMSIMEFWWHDCMLVPLLRSFSKLLQTWVCTGSELPQNVNSFYTIALQNNIVSPSEIALKPALAGPPQLEQIFTWSDLSILLWF